MQLITSILHSFTRELREVKQNRLYLTLIVILPLVALLFYTIIFSGGNIEKLPIVVVDDDHSQMSHRLTNMLNATRGIEIVGYAPNAEVAEKWVQSGKSYGFIVIPNNMEANIYSNTSSTVELFISGANISASGIIERDAQRAILTFSAGISLNKLVAEGVNYHQAMIEVSPINIQTHIISNPYLNYGYYLAPVFMFMTIVIFVVLATIYAVGRELYYATAEDWINSSDNLLVGAVIGKLLPTTIIMVVHMQLIFILLFSIMGMECEGSYPIITLSSILFIAAYQSVALLIIALTSNLRLALSLGGGYAVMAFTFSGITFPTTAMFDIAVVFSKIFPLGYFTEIFINEAMRGTPLQYSSDNIAILCIFTLLAPIAIIRLRHIVRNPKYWKRD